MTDAPGPRHFAYRLIAPRPTFHEDMSEAEAAAMEEHVAYWQPRIEAGSVVVFGVVIAPSGPWGLAVVEADDAEAVMELGRGDPAVTSGVCTFEVGAMPGATVRGA